MKKLLVMLAMLVATPAVAEPTKGYYTMDAMGCMLLQECTKDVKRINSLQDIEDHYPGINFSGISTEFNSIFQSLNTIGVKVFLADEKYFPPMHRGVYHTVGNNFFLNTGFMKKPHVLMAVMRHEGWHAAQDCMAGTIKNSMLAIIKNEEDVPGYWREVVEDTYPKHAVPWEAEAFWAGHTANMTADALKVCATGTMWEIYPPTPLTKKWLKEEGYIK